LTKNAVLNKES